MPSLTPQEDRRKRLATDYEDMVKIKSRVIDWRASLGQLPYFERYDITVRVRTIVAPNTFSAETHVIVTLPDEYPYQAPPLVKIDTSRSRTPYHPNWWNSMGRAGLWCSGPWFPAERLGRHVLRMVRTLQFDPVVTNPASAANGEANRWWLTMLDSGLFPCDRQHLAERF